MASDDESSSKGLLDTATVMALATALVYVAGWTYALNYFANFGAGLLSLDIPREYFFLYGFWVFRDSWWLVLLYIGVVALSIWIKGSSMLQGIGRGWRTALMALLPILFLGMVAGVEQVGREFANAQYRTQADARFAGYPQARVWLKDEGIADERLKQAVNDLAASCYRLLIRDKEKLYLFHPPPNATAVHLALLDVPLDAVRAVRVLPDAGDCPSEVPK